MAKVLSVAADKCVACRICEQWCSYSHGRAVGPATTCIRVQRLHHLYQAFPVVCLQCGRPACIDACLFGALSQNEVTGAIIVDERKCKACRKCITVCPYGAVNYDSLAKTVRICDLCAGEPTCVARCPEKAISYIDKNSEVNEYRLKCSGNSGGEIL